MFLIKNIYHEMMSDPILSYDNKEMMMFALWYIIHESGPKIPYDLRCMFPECSTCVFDPHSMVNIHRFKENFIREIFVYYFNDFHFHINYDYYNIEYCWEELCNYIIWKFQLGDKTAYLIKENYQERLNAVRGI